MTVICLTQKERFVRAASLAAIHADALAESGARPWSQSEFEELALRESCELFSAGQGFLVLDVVAQEAEILTFAVAPTVQGQGFGRAILEFSIMWMDRCNIKRCCLEVAADNSNAVLLYESVQFKRVSVRQRYYRRPNGAVDGLIMEKNFKN